jgi:hypothetical protein
LLFLTPVKKKRKRASALQTLRDPTILHRQVFIVAQSLR